MLHRPMRIILVGAVVTTVSPLAVRSVQAQGTGGYYYETYIYGYNPGYFARTYSVRPSPFPSSKIAPFGAPIVYYVGPATAPAKSSRTQPVDIRLGYGTPAPVLADGPAQIELQMPAGAQVWFGGQKTTQTGTRRQFESPSLTAGRAYTYDVRVTWREGEREVTESRRLTVHAGDRLNASFPAPATLSSGEAMSTPR
jgi:uncharacterized protein (TIGR03000 family)